MDNEYINVPWWFELPKGKEVRFLNYLEEYLLNKEKENPNIRLWKIDLPWFTIFWIHEIILISREFWFIERLVKNNKINLYKSWIEELPAMYGYDYESVECKSDRLLMLLSIQENPIEFLISILKIS